MLSFIYAKEAALHYLIITHRVHQFHATTYFINSE